MDLELRKWYLGYCQGQKRWKRLPCTSHLLQQYQIKLKAEGSVLQEDGEERSDEAIVIALADNHNFPHSPLEMTHTTVQALHIAVTTPEGVS